MEWLWTWVSTETLSIGGFVLLVAVLAALRIYSQGRVTIEIKEIVAAVAVVGLALFVFGEISEIVLGELKLVRALKEAEATSVEDRLPQLATKRLSSETLVFEEEETQAKGASTRIPVLIETQATALSFELGSEYYVARVVADYLLQLTEAPHLRYLVFNDHQGRLVGIADARAIAARFRAPNRATVTPNQLTDWIEQADINALSLLPGFVSAEVAIQVSASTRQALNFMVQEHAELLPVVDAAGVFKGIVHRDQLVLAILNALTGPATEG